MITFTLDHNAIIDLEEKRKPGYHALCEILKRYFDQVAITAVSASENPPITNFASFKEKIAKIPKLKNIKDDQILKPMCIFNFSFFDWCLFGDGPGQPMVKLQHDIAFILFPNLFPIQHLNKKTINQLADTMTFWCHVFYGRDIFVTSNTKDFQRKTSNLSFIAKKFHGKDIEILKPEEMF